MVDSSESGQHMQQPATSRLIATHGITRGGHLETCSTITAHVVSQHASSDVQLEVPVTQSPELILTQHSAQLHLHSAVPSIWDAQNPFEAGAFEV